MVTSRTLLAVLSLTAGICWIHGPSAAADSSGSPIPPDLGSDQPAVGPIPDGGNCAQQFWLYGGRGTTRTICDGPVQDDGSWTRCRNFYSPEKDIYVAPIDDQKGSQQYYFPELDIYECYPVTPDTVLPDEPGWIPPGPPP